jgi:hypothetical protein
MGGKALKNVTRKSKEEYQQIKNNILEKFQLENINIDFPIELSEKESFGDLDILYNQNINMKEIIIKLFDPEEIVTNGDVISFNYGDFQIDMIKCKYLEFAKFYFSYGDFGGIMGRIMNHYGFKFGHEGFWLNVYLEKNELVDETHSYGKIILTTCPIDFCKFVGLDYNTFFSLTSTSKIFEYIKSSKYFNPLIFETLNYDHNKRAKKRPMYISFLNDINIITDRGGTHINENLQLVGIKYFNKEDEYEKIFNNLKRKKEISNKFNGKILLDLGVNQKSIGIIIKKFREKYNDEWILDNNENTIINELKSNFI